MLIHVVLDIFKTGRFALWGIKMEKIMKKILISLLITPSLMAYADGVNLIEPGSLTSPIVIAKAVESGVTFTSNQVQYQFIEGGRAIAKNDTSISARSALTSTNNLWSDEHGPYFVSIESEGRISNSSLTNNGVNFKQIAYNPATGNVAIITGEIVVKIEPTYSAETIAASLNIELLDFLENISYAYFQVGSDQDIFTIAQNLTGHPGVASAEIIAHEDYRQTR